jgi:hypothetical protein
MQLKPQQDTNHPTQQVVVAESSQLEIGETILP